MKHFLWAVSVFVCLCATSPAGATIRYTVSLAEPQQHLFHVTMTVPEVRNDLVVQLPAWNALYQIRDFAQRVLNLRATDAAKQPLPVIKVNKQTWRIQEQGQLGAASPVGRGTITLEYAVYWDEPSPFSSQLNRNHAFLNLATLLCYVPDRRREDVRLGFTAVPEGWKIAAPLERTEAPATFLAPGYDALVDAPVEIGAFEEFRLELGDASRKFGIRVVVHGEGWKRESLADIVHRIAAYETQLMREVPFAEYLFIYHFGQGGGGAMEHANSTAIFLDARASPAGVTAHEFFHLWNVKRIRPQSLEPVDYTREQWTRALWFAEGVTSTYGAYTLARSGLWSRQQFYDDLAGQITELEARPARLWKSVEEASLDAWFEKYPLYRRPDLSISFYNKGQILGVLLDILIRDATDNRASLDDVLRYLNEHFARRGRFYQESADLRAAAERVAGRSFEEFFSRYVAGSEEIPYQDFLARAGLLLQPQGRTRAHFGFWAARGPEDVSVATQIEPGSAAERAGVSEGDVLLEINAAPFPRNPRRWLEEHRPGQTVRLRVRRPAERDEEKELSFALGERREHGYKIEEEHRPSDRQRRIREGLLRGITD